MLILDLDDTIFETKSMNPRIFDSAMAVIGNHYETYHSKAKSEEIINALWSYPIDIVFKKYNVEEVLINQFYQMVNEIDFRELEIKTFEDYKELKKLDARKTLVTTGLKELQYAKIKALGIENDFEGIFVDDPRVVPRRTKIDIFRQLLADTKLAPHQFWVIGDNPESEIKAGNELGMKTIQRTSKSKELSKLADYKIDSFEELEAILK